MAKNYNSSENCHNASDKNTSNKNASRNTSNKNSYGKNAYDKNASSYCPIDLFETNANDLKNK